LEVPRSPCHASGSYTRSLLRGTDSRAARFDKTTIASFWKCGTEITPIGFYPKSFPDDSFSTLYTPAGKIETLGELRTDADGRLLVLGGFGKACGWLQLDGTPFPLSDDDVNSDGWFDDTGDDAQCFSMRLSAVRGAAPCGSDLASL